MLGQIGFGFGGFNSPLISSQPDGVGAKPLSHRTPAQTNNARANSADLVSDSEVDALDIEKSLQMNKELSLAYQIMRAISKLNDTGLDTTSSAIESFEMNLSYEFSYQTSQFQLSQLSSGQESSVSQVFASSLSVNLDLSISLSADGDRVSFNMAFDFTRTSFSFQNNQSQEEKQVDPLILNLSDEDFSFDLSHQVEFDLDADGEVDRFYTPSEQNYLLAIDKNANGMIDNGKELFGDADGADDGFAALRAYDENGDQVIDKRDSIYNQLLLLALSGEGQKITSLAEKGVTSIYLTENKSNQQYENDNRLASESRYVTEDGRSGRVGDFWITVR